MNNLRNQIALFILALAPFWTSYLTRSVAWTYPLMGREGGLNQVLGKLGIPGAPFEQLGFSELSVTLAMIQLYILFMVTPLFFTLSQVDRTALEAARDLGGNWLRTFREVILPQAMPGVVIGSIFIFVLTMGEYGTVRVIGGNVDLVGRHDRPVEGRDRRPVSAGRGLGGAARRRPRRGRVRDHAFLEPARGPLT